MQSLDIGTEQQLSQFHLPDHNTHFSVQLNNGMQSQDHICYTLIPQHFDLTLFIST